MRKISRKRLLLIVAGIVVAIAVVSIFLSKVSVSSDTYITKRGNLEAKVSCMGEIQGEKATLIELPPVLCDRELRIWDMKIVDLIQEGKSVKKGDYIARLDESVIMNPMRENMQQKERMDSDLRNMKIDSAVVLTQKRENITNALLDLQYKRIDVEQSKFDAGAQQRKAQMAYQKAEIDLERMKRDYLLERNKQKTQVSRMEDRVAYYDKMIKKYQEAMASTRILAPEEGIVMFAKDWMGKRLNKDSYVGPWNPLIATLPDMSVVVSESYVKEIDIAKVNVGDSVSITIDALQGKQFPGKIYHIATIGEDHKNFDMKVFKVMIRFNHSDKDLKPGMTSTNNIILQKYNDALIVPLEAVFSENGDSFVYLKNGGSWSKQLVKTGADDETNVVILEGLNAGDKILMHKPAEG